MFPTLLSIGNFALSSYGVFLSLGFLFGVFLIWRLSRAWDLNEEKILDLTLLTFLGSLIGARLYFGLVNIAFFTSSPWKLIFINKYPGFSFWGAFLGGWLTLFYLTRRSGLNFWQIADIAVVGFLGGLIISDIGCFLGGCGVGSQTHSFLGVPMAGLIGKRWPVQLFEAAAFSLALMNIWSKATHFHQRGKIVSLSLILMGVIKLILSPFKTSSDDYIFSSLILLLGITIFYKITGRNVFNDLKDLVHFLLKPALVLGTLKKVWYNQKIAVAWRISGWKKVLRRYNVKFSPKNNKIS